VVVVAGRERAVAAHGDQPAAELADVLLQGVHLFSRQRRGRHVGEDHQLVGLQVGQLPRHVLRRQHIKVDQFVLQGSGQRLGQHRAALDQQHPRPPADEYQGRRLIILRHGVCEIVQPGGEHDFGRLIRGVPEANVVFAGSQTLLLLAGTLRP